LSQIETTAAETREADAPLKHPSTRQLFAYWDAQRGLRPAPERDDIDPGAIRRVLADTFMLAVDPRAGHPFRIAGTRVCAAFGRELRSTAFIDLWRRADRQLIGDLLAAVRLETIGLVASARAESANGDTVFELLLLPLGYHGQADARLLGALAPTEMPYWFGASPLSRLALGSHRFLPPGVSGDLWSDLVPRQAPARLVRGLLVYDGGRDRSPGPLDPS
jgi:hypothetical protein